MRFPNSIIIVLSLVLFSISVSSDINIPDVGYNWKSKVDSALTLIQKTDTASYNMITQNCNNIEFIVADASTTKPPGTIAITTTDMKLGSLNNIAAILVHESYHLYVYNNHISMTEREEEHEAYIREYIFLCRLSTVEDWLFKNVINQILKYQ